MQYHTIPHHARPYRVVLYQYHTMPYHTAPYHTTPYHFTPYICMKKKRETYPNKHPQHTSAETLTCLPLPPESRETLSSSTPNRSSTWRGHRRAAAQKLNVENGILHSKVESKNAFEYRKTNFVTDSIDHYSGGGHVLVVLHRCWERFKS